jgi:large subunit ribosomal protein L34e
MVRPSLRSRSRRRLMRRSPGGRALVHHEVRFSSRPRCAVCGKTLGGIDEARVKTMHLPLDPPSRPYGGYVCHRCLSLGLRLSVRGMSI